MLPDRSLCFLLHFIHKSLGIIRTDIKVIQSDLGEEKSQGQPFSLSFYVLTI